MDKRDCTTMDPHLPSSTYDVQRSKHRSIIFVVNTSQISTLSFNGSTFMFLLQEVKVDPLLFREVNIDPF